MKIEHLLDHPWVTFIEGGITDLDLLMETFPGADGIFGGDPLRVPVGEGSARLERGERDRTLDVLVVVTVRCRPWFVDLDLWRLPSFEIMQSSRSPNAA